jgi:subfamily B ATP-binding cassette protein MsbA
VGALPRPADPLVLDGATGELDGELEARVHAGIEALDRECAVVAVARRLSTVTTADAIHVVDGRVVESGTHDDLLAAGGRYAALHASLATAAAVAAGGDD